MGDRKAKFADCRPGKPLPEDVISFTKFIARLASSTAPAGQDERPVSMLYCSPCSLHCLSLLNTALHLANHCLSLLNAALHLAITACLLQVALPTSAGPTDEEQRSNTAAQEAAAHMEKQAEKQQEDKKKATRNTAAAKRAGKKDKENQQPHVPMRPAGVSEIAAQMVSV